MKKVTEILKAFRDERDWAKFHTPERLAMSLNIESGELASLFQWGKTPKTERVKEELADVLIYGLYLAEKYGLDIKDIILEKIEKNGKKYPAGENHAQVHGWENKQI